MLMLTSSEAPLGGCGAAARLTGQAFPLWMKKQAAWASHPVIRASLLSAVRLARLRPERLGSLAASCPVGGRAVTAEQGAG